MATTKAKTIKRRVRKIPATKKTTRKHLSLGNKISFGRFDSVSAILNKLEVEAERIARRLIERAEEASSELRGSIEDLLGKFRSNDIYSIATDRKEDFERELHRLVEDVVERAKDVELLPFNAANRDRIISEAKKNLEELRVRLSAMDWVSKARMTAHNTKDQVFSLLNIPSQDELLNLQKKLANLEKRVSTLNRKAA